MKRIINIPREDVAEQIANELGCNYMTKDIGDGNCLYCFVETDKLHKYLKKNFSKKEFFYDNKVFL